MKKMCIAALMAAAGAGAHAQATSSVVIYGIIDATLRHNNNADANRASVTTLDDGVFTGSRLGFRGREDLGGGVSALFTLESGFDPSTGASQQGTPTADFGQVAANPRFWGREIHVGLRGAAWGITLGRQYTIAHMLSGRFQPQGNPNSQADAVFSSHHVARQDNVVRLDTKVAGVDLLLGHTFGERDDNSANSTTALGLGYTAGPVSFAAYVQHLNNLAGTEERKIIGAGGNYKVTNALTMYFGAMRRTNEVSPQRNNAWTLGTNIELTPQITLSAAYLADRQTGSAALDGRRKISWVSPSYRFSRRTDVYAVFNYNRVEDGYARPAFMGTKGSQAGLNLGVRHRF